MAINRAPVTDPRVHHYALAIVLTGFALLLRLKLMPYFGSSTPFVTLAIMISAWYGGIGPGLLSTFICSAFIISNPNMTMSAATVPTASTRLPSSLTILLIGILISFLQESLHRTKRRLEQSAQELREANALLNETNDSFRMLVQNVRDHGIFMLDPEGRVASWNTGAERVKGYTADEIIGKHFSIFYESEDIEAGKTDMELKVAAEEGSFEDFGWRRRKDGSLFWANVMITAVRDENGKLRGFSKVTRDLTERKQAEESNQLLIKEQAARVEAEAANRAKDQFLSVLSHELRTPLNAILGWASMLRSKRLDAETASQAVESIQRSAKIQALLVEDLIDVSRMISGKFSIDPHPISLAPVIEAAVDKVLPSAKEKNIALDVRSDEVTATVLGDTLRLEQVLLNLLSNAIKFTPTGGSVALRVDLRGDDVCITVTDTGQGIPAEILPLIFERFRQADSSSTRGHGGLGLGLAIVRYVVEAHGGTVTAASDGPGSGATFTVSLPLIENEPRELVTVLDDQVARVGANANEA